MEKTIADEAEWLYCKECNSRKIKGWTPLWWKQTGKGKWTPDEESPKGLSLYFYCVDCEKIVGVTNG